jgi:hypothetical protein
LDLLDTPAEIDISRQLAAFIEEWLSRAGTCPLSFSVQGYPDTEEYESDAICVALIRHAPRLESVMLQLETTQFDKLVGAGPFPLLEKLSIALLFLDSELDEGFSAKVFADAPRLRWRAWEARTFT